MLRSAVGSQTLLCRRLGTPSPSRAALFSGRPTLSDLSSSPSGFSSTATVARGARQTASTLQLVGRHGIIARRAAEPSRSCISPIPSSRLLLSPLQSRPGSQMLRALSSSSSGDQKTSDSSKGGDEQADTKEIVMTPGEQVVAASRLTMWAGIAVFAACCAYYIGKELFPTKMSPNRVFDRSFAIVRKDPEVIRRYGESLKAYGRDHGGHREGRRNFVEHTEYVDQEDGSKRTRVRYNLEGRHGMAFVFAEVSNNMPAGEFVYILVQDRANGRVWTVQDNRAALTAARLAAGNQEAQSAMSQLLRGSGSSDGSQK